MRSFRARVWIHQAIGTREGGGRRQCRSRDHRLPRKQAFAGQRESGGREIWRMLVVGQADLVDEGAGSRAGGFGGRWESSGCVATLGKRHIGLSPGRSTSRRHWPAPPNRVGRGKPRRSPAFLKVGSGWPRSNYHASNQWRRRQYPEPRAGRNDTRAPDRSMDLSLNRE